MDFSPVQTLCDKLGVEYIRVPTQIGPIVFDIRHEENPCSLCAKPVSYTHLADKPLNLSSAFTCLLSDGIRSF